MQAVVEDIIMHAPNLENLKQLVLMGESAGAYGVGFNCDFVADRFHEVMPDLDMYLCICEFVYVCICVFVHLFICAFVYSTWKSDGCRGNRSFSSVKY